VDLPDHPEDGAHFDGQRDPFYEGWYHKISLPDSDEAFFFIYSVVNPLPGSAHPSEAFLYCGQASSLDSIYQSFPVEAYRASTRCRDVRIGPKARATALRFAGMAEDADGTCAWDIWLDESLVWPETMGWLTGQAGLETSWTVGTLRAQATGWIEFKGQRFEFSQAVAYGDHNWGSVFPRQWFWLQANEFPSGDGALAVSGGTVLFGETEIEAEMIGLWLAGGMHTFRTQDLNPVSAQVRKGHWSLQAEQDLERITIEASCDPDSLFHLLAPTPQGVQPRAWESLAGSVHVVLEQRADPATAWRTVFDDTSVHAGVELGLDE
jgi:tocopherol cyclase